LNALWKYETQGGPQDYQLTYPGEGIKEVKKLRLRRFAPQARSACFLFFKNTNLFYLCRLQHSKGAPFFSKFWVRALPSVLGLWATPSKGTRRRRSQKYISLELFSRRPNAISCCLGRARATHESEKSTTKLTLAAPKQFSGNPPASKPSGPWPCTWDLSVFQIVLYRWLGGRRASTSTDVFPNYGPVCVKTSVGKVSPRSWDM
jgi:hypothetical protein